MLHTQSPADVPVNPVYFSRFIVHIPTNTWILYNMFITTIQHLHEKPFFSCLHPEYNQVLLRQAHLNLVSLLWCLSSSSSCQMAGSHLSLVQRSCVEGTDSFVQNWWEKLSLWPITFVFINKSMLQHCQNINLIWLDHQINVVNI